MSLDLAWSNRDRPVELLSSLLNSHELLSAFHEFIIYSYDPVEAFGEDRIKNFVRDNFAAEEIFSEEELKLWAEENGFTESA